jgi:integrase
MATIEKYKTGGGTLYRVRHRTPDGRQTSKRGFRTKREAEVYLSTVEVAKMKGEYVSPSLGKVTVGELGQAWLDRQSGHLKPSSAAAYDSAWRNQVLSRWGHVRVGDVRFSAVQSWVSELSTRLGAESVKKAFGVLAQILDDAVRDRMLASNPARGVKLPRPVPRQNVYLTVGQLEHLAEESGDYRSLILLLGVGGLRWGEAAALRVADIDFLHRRIQLHRNVTPVRGKMIPGTLKGNENRTVVPPVFVVEALSRTCEGKDREDLLWTSSSGGYLAPPGVKSWLSRAVACCQKDDPGFPRITAHDLRHTAVSLAISSGANVKVVQRMLGHSSAAMTLDVYADLFDSDLDSAADNVAKMWPQEAKKGSIAP